MFKGLRLRLTLLYLSAALLLVTLVGGAAYGLLWESFQSATDHALQQRMAQEFRRFGAPLPPELAAAAATGAGSYIRPSATARPGDDDSGHTSGDSGSQPHTGEEPEETYDAELAAIFILPLDAGGTVLSRLNTAAPPIAPDREAAGAALARGSDRRTVRLDGVPVRLLSYRIAGPEGLVVLQLGRTLIDQERFLRQLVVGLLALGGAGTALLGLGSWWLAGRSLRPAQAAWARQRTFVVNASHELRTPLTLLRASAEVARRRLPAEDVAGRELLGDVLGECDHMTRLVEDLLLLSKLDAGALPLDREAVQPAGFLAEIGRRAGRLAAERGVELTVEAGVDGAVWVDPARLRQVLLILLDNALRHTPAGGTVRLGARSHGHQIALTVADTGAGIAPADLPYVFERFYRADQARTSGEDNGSGLGLAIARALIEAHGGQIRLESRLGAGTRVEVTLPTARD